MLQCGAVAEVVLGERVINCIFLYFSIDISLVIDWNICMMGSRSAIRC